MTSLTLKPTHKAVIAYYDSLAQFARLGITHETAVRSAFQELLEHCARQCDWKLVPEYRLKRKGQADVSADGAIFTCVGNIPTLVRGLWEAKDSADDLDKEIKHKFKIGYRGSWMSCGNSLGFLTVDRFCTASTQATAMKKLFWSRPTASVVLCCVSLRAIIRWIFILAKKKRLRPKPRRCAQQNPFASLPCRQS